MTVDLEDKVIDELYLRYKNKNRDCFIYCKSCDSVGIGKYIGTQYLREKPIFDLYNCPECNTTLAHNHTSYYLKNFSLDKDL